MVYNIILYNIYTDPTASNVIETMWTLPLACFSQRNNEKKRAYDVWCCGYAKHICDTDLLTHSHHLGYRPSSPQVAHSTYFFADISVRSPRKMFIFIIWKNISWITVSKKYFIWIWKQKYWLLGMSHTQAFLYEVFLQVCNSNWSCLIRGVHPWTFCLWCCCQCLFFSRNTA